MSEAFLHGVWGNTWGEGCYDDVMAVADALAARPEVDGARLVAMGGSFGGYMANWIGANSDRFRCLVSHAGVFAFSHFHGTTDSPAFWALRMGGQTPWGDLEDYDRYSAHRFVARWRTPALVIHGERDYRVPIGEALALFEALQHHGVPSELLVFPDENHWILKPRNVRVWYRTWLDFVARHSSARRQPLLELRQRVRDLVPGRLVGRRTRARARAGRGPRRASPGGCGSTSGFAFERL